jgi:hypothetical protein
MALDAECCYADCHYAECHYAECRYDKFCDKNVACQNGELTKCRAD